MMIRATSALKVLKVFSASSESSPVALSSSMAGFQTGRISPDSTILVKSCNRVALPSNPKARVSCRAVSEYAFASRSSLAVVSLDKSAERRVCAWSLSITDVDGSLKFGNEGSGMLVTTSLSGCAIAVNVEPIQKEQTSSALLGSYSCET